MTLRSRVRFSWAPGQIFVRICWLEGFGGATIADMDRGRGCGHDGPLFIKIGEVCAIWTTMHLAGLIGMMVEKKWSWAEIAILFGVTAHFFTWGYHRCSTTSSSFTELIGGRSFLSYCSSMAMDRWGSLSAFQLAKNKNGMAFWTSYCDFNGRLVSGSNLMVISENLPCFLLESPTNITIGRQG